MKKILLSLFIIFGVTLSACSASNTTNQAGSTSQSGPTSRALTTELKLIIGTFKLEKTNQAVTAEQAASLLPLWQVYNELTSSGTSAQAEVDALLSQIQDTMTADQMKTINAMNLTQQDAFALMQSQGVMPDMNAGNSTAAGDSSSSSGGIPAGGPPDAGGSPMDGGPMGSPTGSNTNQSSSTITTQMNPNAPLVNALIELLQSKLSS